MSWPQPPTGERHLSTPQPEGLDGASTVGIIRTDKAPWLLVDRLPHCPTRHRMLPPAAGAVAGPLVALVAAPLVAAPWIGRGGGTIAP